METTEDPGNGFSQQCSSCDGSSARCWCLDCNEALCNVCVSAHRRVTLTRSHRILNQPPAETTSAPPTKFCRLHPSETLKLFCFTCNQLTCRDCQLMAHMNHRYQFVSEALDSLKKQLELLVQPIRAHRGTAGQSLLDMETRLQEVSESESNLKTELQQSYYIISRHLKMRMEEILKEVKKVCELEREMIQKRMTRLQQLQRSQQSVAETAEKARNTSDLSALLTYTAQIESQLKELPDQNSSPPQAMSQMKVVTDRKCLEALLSFGQLEVSWIPFSVSRTSNQSGASASALSSSAPLLPACPAAPPCRPLPQTRTTCDTVPPAPPVPVDCTSTLSKCSSTPLCPSPPGSCSTSATPPVSARLLPSCRTLPQTGNKCDTDSPVRLTCLSTLKSSSNQLSLPPASCPSVNPPPPSTVTTLSHLGAKPRQVLLPKSPAQRVSASVKLQPVTVGFPPSAGPPQSCALVRLVKPPLVLNQPTAPHQKPPAAVPPVDTQTAYQVSCWPPSLSSLVPQFPVLLSPTVSYAVPGNTCRKQQDNCGSLQLLPVAATPVGPSPSALPSRTQKSHDVRDIIDTTITSGPRPSPEALTSEISPRSSSLEHQLLCLPPSSSCPSSSAVTPPTSTCSPLPHTDNTGDAASPVPVSCPPSSGKSSSNQQSPPPSSCPSVDQSGAELAVSGGPLSSPGSLTSDVSLSSSVSPVVRAVADSACDRSVQQVAARQQEHAENEPTSTVSEEGEPGGKPSGRDEEEPSAVTGHSGCSLSQWQPTVSLFRLPVSPPRPGRPLSGFRLVPGDGRDEIYLEEMSDDSQSHADDVTDDITEPLSSPDSPVMLQIVSCSACGSAHSSVICSACGRGYHRECHVPPVGPRIWSEWICSLCQDLSDPADPYSSDRPPSPPSPRLSLLDQRRCESLLLYLKVEGHRQLSQLGVWPQLKVMSDSLTLRRSPAYPTAAEFLSDIWSLFPDASQDDDLLNKLQESFQSREMETFSSELHPSAPMAASSSPLDASDGDEVVGRSRGSKVTSEDQRGVASESRLKMTRKRLREFLDLVGTSGSKRLKVESHDRSPSDL